jgi:hypothetical protein
MEWQDSIILAPQFCVNDFANSAMLKILGETLPSKQWRLWRTAKD